MTSSDQVHPGPQPWSCWTPTLANKIIEKVDGSRRRPDSAQFPGQIRKGCHLLLEDSSTSHSSLIDTRLCAFAMLGENGPGGPAPIWYDSVRAQITAFCT